MKLVFFRGPGLMASLIRWHSRGQWNHVAIWDEEERVLYEAREWRGVIRTEPWWPAPDHHVCDVCPTLTEFEAKGLRHWLQRQVGKRYDWASVAKFLSRRKADLADADRRWFCSELAMEAFRAVGRELLRAPGWKVSPAALSWSPALVPCPL